MKQIVCEMCGGTDLVKEDGVFICKSCGMKYTADDAKKLMVEVDNSKKLANLYERARKSLEVDDLEHAAEYYKQILDENPNDWEAYFYSYLGEFPTFTNAQAGSVASKLGNTIPPAYDMAVLDCEAETIAERVKTITTKTADRITVIAATAASLLRQYEGGSIVTPAGKVNSDMYSRMRGIAQSTIISCVLAYDPLDSKIVELADASKINDDVKKESLLYIRKAKYTIANVTFRPTSATTEKLLKSEAIRGYAEKIKEIDPSFEVPAETTTSSGNSSGGCYVATAVYGSYDCPQVWTLRRYRDYTLAETWYGRAFIHTYYAISPTLVKWFGNTEWFKKMWKGRLDRMVAKLQSQGVESSPYEDRKW